MRSLTRTAGEIFKERWQARRQVKRDFDPRVHRDWTFAVLRAVTNGLLRDLNTALVAEELRRGTKSIYVDYVDYDEIAHHAGMFRPESLAALDGLDRTLGSLARLAGSAPRRYRLVVLSDHGQSQGTPFADRYGQTLGDLCAELMQEAHTKRGRVRRRAGARELHRRRHRAGRDGRENSRPVPTSGLTKAQQTSGPGDGTR